MFNRIIEAFGAWRRNERRVAPYGARGRVFEKKNPEVAQSSPGNVNVKAGPTATLEMKITRKDGTVETIVVPATAELIK